MRRDISPADEATRLARLRDTLGCKAFKIRLGTPGGRNQDAAPGRSEAIIPAVRKAVGPEIELHADANSCYTPDVAIAMGRRLEDARYAAFEEPCPYWELEWTQEVTRGARDRRAGRRAGQRPGPVAPHDRHACRRHRAARHLLRRRPDPRLARRQDGRGRRPRDQAARGQRLAGHGVHDAPAGGAAQGRRSRVLDRGRRGHHASGSGDVRSGPRDEGRARRDARRPRGGACGSSPTGWRAPTVRSPRPSVHSEPTASCGGFSARKAFSTDGRRISRRSSGGLLYVGRTPARVLAPDADAARGLARAPRPHCGVPLGSRRRNGPTPAVPEHGHAPCR